MLLGRSKQCQKHPGNLRYRQLIASQLQDYEAANRAGKTAIANAMVEIVKGYSGRFLVEHYADFIEVSDFRAREKVAHSFRTLRSKSQKNVTAEGRPNSCTSVPALTLSTCQPSNPSDEDIRGHPGHNGREGTEPKRKKTKLLVAGNNK